MVNNKILNFRCYLEPFLALEITFPNHLHFLIDLEGLWEPYLILPGRGTYSSLSSCCQRPSTNTFKMSPTPRLTL